MVITCRLATVTVPFFPYRFVTMSLRVVTSAPRPSPPSVYTAPTLVAPTRAHGLSLPRYMDDDDNQDHLDWLGKTDLFGGLVRPRGHDSSDNPGDKRCPWINDESDRRRGSRRRRAVVVVASHGQLSPVESLGPTGLTDVVVCPATEATKRMESNTAHAPPSQTLFLATIPARRLVDESKRLHRRSSHDTDYLDPRVGHTSDDEAAAQSRARVKKSAIKAFDSAFWTLTRLYRAFHRPQASTDAPTSRVTVEDTTTNSTPNVYMIHAAYTALLQSLARLTVLDRECWDAASVCLEVEPSLASFRVFLGQELQGMESWPVDLDRGVCS